MAAKIKIPEKLRVTFKAQSERIYLKEGDYTQYEDRPTAPLGFANVYEPNNKAYLKRKKTQDDWAYRSWHGGIEEDENGQLTMVMRDWDRSVKPPILKETREAVPAELQPRIIDNIPLDGFYITKSVSRYSTSNKLWRILDPRGFELEIPSSNLETLILEGEIWEGMIIGQCVWAGPKHLIRVERPKDESQ